MKLEGLRVIDLSMYLPGPHLTLMMADHGAEVIRVEPPGGEPARKYGPFQAGHSVWFRNTHRGKQSICLNLKDDTDREKLLKLCETADVFVEGFRPGVVKRLGVDYEAVKARNPRIVYCSVSAFGQTGPLANKPSHDMGAQALTGFLAINDCGDGRPAVPGLPGADMGSSLIGLSGILMALYRREKTGQGDYVDAAMYDALLSWTAHLTGSVFAESKPPTTQTGRSIGGAAFYNIYETKDGRYIALTGREPKFVTSLLSTLNLTDLIEVCCSDDCEAQEPAKKALADAFRGKTQAEWIQFLEPLELAWAPVLDMVEAFQQEHAKAREMIITDPDGIRHVGNPIKFQEEPAQLRFDVPELDEVSSTFT
jgi:crotonobetainyl-CoA:carnitine CoA-transferase CaiB-like acyl-CoA transferase